MSQADESLLTSCIHTFRLSWKALALTDIVYKVVGFVVLAPLVAVLFRVFLAFSGRSVLVDQDILFFLLGPVGWVSLIIVGAAWIAIVALEQAALMLIAYGAAEDQRVGVRSALYFAARHAWPVFRVTARMVALVLAAGAPFLAVAGVVYLLLLTQYDINFYLAEKPPVFWVAAVLIGCVLSAMVVVLALMLVRWVFALPLLLFEDVATGAALRTSGRRTSGHRRTIMIWMVGWLVATMIASALATGAVGLVGRFIVPLATGSLTLLIATVGAMLLLLGAVNVILTLLNATTFSVLLVGLYRKLGGGGGARMPQLATEESIGTGAGFLLSRRTLLIESPIAVLLAALVGVVALGSVRLDDHTEIMAHRGASAAAPENTLAAVERAITDGADWVEVDVQESADGVVVVVHDSDLKKAAGVDLKIWEATAEELRAVDIGSPFGSEFAGQRVPTLEEVLDVCKGRVRLNIELKYYGHDQKLEQRVVELVEKHQMQSDVVIMSLKYDGIQKVRSLRPQWKIGLLSAVAVGDLTRLDADFLAVSLGLASRRFVRSAQRSGKEVYVWTVNDPITMSAMMGRGVDSIITDKPALARSVREQRAGLSPVERLFVELAVLFGVTLETDLTIDAV